MKLLGIGSRIKHASYGIGVITNVSNIMYWVTFVDQGLETITIDAEFEIIEAIDGEVNTVIFSDIESSLRSMLKKWSDISEIVPIADKWKGGMLVLEPGDASLSEKKIPIDTFFHKVIMVRDRIRVMEQKINASRTMDNQDKVDLQQYITRVYGSLTTFNVLFKNTSQQFVGERTKK